jgi:hypothetical protein
MTKPNDPRRKQWDKTYRERHKEKIRNYRKINGADAELRRDPVKRAVSRKAYYERSKARWMEYQRNKRKSVKDWWSGVLGRIEEIANKENKV